MPSIGNGLVLHEKAQDQIELVGTEVTVLSLAGV